MCHFPAAMTLKDKRRVLRSVLTRIKNKHNISVAEVDKHNHIQSGVIGMAAVANTKKRVEQELNNALKFLDREHEIEVLSVDSWYG